MLFIQLTSHYGVLDLLLLNSFISFDGFGFCLCSEISFDLGFDLGFAPGGGFDADLLVVVNKAACP